jgi:hypothetical protein
VSIVDQLTGNAASTQPGVIAQPWVLNSVPVEQRPRRAARLDGVRTSREKAMKAVRFDQYGGRRPQGR